MPPTDDPSKVWPSFSDVCADPIVDPLPADGEGDRTLLDDIFTDYGPLDQDFMFVGSDGVEVADGKGEGSGVSMEELLRQREAEVKKVKVELGPLGFDDPDSQPLQMVSPSSGSVVEFKCLPPSTIKVVDIPDDDSEPEPSRKHTRKPR